MEGRPRELADGADLPSPRVAARGAFGGCGRCRRERLRDRLHLTSINGVPSDSKASFLRDVLFNGQSLHPAYLELEGHSLRIEVGTGVYCLLVNL